MRLYYAELLAPRKACAMARHLAQSGGPEVEFVRLDIARGEHKRPDYLCINPNGTVPALTDGALSLWEADAIMCHLSRRAGADLWPSDGAEQIDVLRWLSWGAQHFIRCGGSLYFEYVVKPMFGIGPPDAASVAEASADFRRHCGVLEAYLDGREWLAADRLTVADFAVGITLPYARQAHMPLAEFPRVEAWHGRLCELQAWREPFPSAVGAAISEEIRI